MPKTKLQNIIFTLIMAFVMVYAMVCYNIALDKGGMTNEIFLLAFHEIPIMWPIACILEYFAVEKLSRKLAFRMVSPEDKPVFITAEDRPELPHGAVLADLFRRPRSAECLWICCGIYIG